MLRFRGPIFVYLLLPSISLAYPVHGVGTSSCADFAKMYQGDPQNVEQVFFSWAQGFMSGLNMAAMATQKPTRELAGDTTDQKRALRAFCANNPLKNYMDGAIEYYGKLRFFLPNSN